MVTIEKGVPFRDGRTDGRRPKYPWSDMEVGDSFRVEGVTRNAMSATARYHAKKTGRTYRAATEGTGVRVWRMA